MCNLHNTLCGYYTSYVKMLHKKVCYFVCIFDMTILTCTIFFDEVNYGLTNSQTGKINS